MDYSITHSPTPSTSTQAKAPPKQRASKACQHCQSRRKKCTANPPHPCENCIKAGLGHDCFVRERARPNRKLFAGARLNRHGPLSNEMPSGGPSPPMRTQLSPQGTTLYHVPREPRDQQDVPFFRLLEMDLERMYKDKTGRAISLSLPDQFTHPLLEIEVSRPPLPALSDSSELLLLLTFLSTLKRMLTFLSSPTLLSLHTRIRSQPHSVKPDEMALFYCMLCLGKFRLLTYDLGTGRDLELSEGDRRDDIVYYRWARSSLSDQKESSVVALQALCMLHLFMQATGTTAACRELIEKAVLMAHDLGLNRIQTALAYDLEDKVGALYFYVVFIDLYHASLVGVPPLIKLTDYDSVVFDSFNRTLVTAVVIQSSLLSNLHNTNVDTTSSEFVLRYEEQWGDWLNKALEDELLANEMQDSMVIIHYHWDRIVLRTPCIFSRPLSVSSLAIVARSASQILNSYHAIVLGGRFNLAWPQLRRIVTTAYLVIETYWRRELMQKEAEELLAIAMECLEVLKIRWRSVAEVEVSLMALAGCLDLSLTPPGSNSTVTSPSQSAPSPSSISNPPSAPHHTLSNYLPDHHSTSILPPTTHFEQLGLTDEQLSSLSQSHSLSQADMQMQLREMELAQGQEELNFGPWMISSGSWEEPNWNLGQGVESVGGGAFAMSSNGELGWQG